ncbi:phage adaptor protein [Enterobacter pseudoroggenkampii]|uniref:phage adaptor protein n=1 Tax=Enterobacter pseudoroggenkampii TaxID=2996112 RepID=UPI002264A261|nr:hypothetical protein [Enterobacter pseudoroggenkampii]MCX8289121.1 hypothetical protein [Enterobacter pseudoroggenkampii]
MAMPTLTGQIETMGDLKKAISLWMNRDDEEFNNNLQNYINFAEKDIYRRLRIPSLQREVYLDVSDGFAYVPVDTILLKYVFNRKTFETYRVTGLEEIQAIRRGKYVPPSNDICFALMGNRLIFSEPLDAPSDGLTTGDIILGYVSDSPELIKDSDSCNILTIAPDLVLYMSLKHASAFVQDDEGAQKWGMLAEAAMAIIQEQANNMEFSGSPLVMPTRFGDDHCSGAGYPYSVIKH